MTGTEELAVSLLSVSCPAIIRPLIRQAEAFERVRFQIQVDTTPLFQDLHRAFDRLEWAVMTRGQRRRWCRRLVREAVRTGRMARFAPVDPPLSHPATR